MRQVYNHTFSLSDSCSKIHLYPWSSKNFTNLESESHSVVSNSLQPHGPYSPWNPPGNWNRQPFPSPGDLPDPGMELGFPALQADSLMSEPPGKPK